VCTTGTTYVTDASIKRIKKLLVGYSFFYDDFHMGEISDCGHVVTQMSQVWNV
jgi:hypothetical protein